MDEMSVSDETADFFPSSPLCPAPVASMSLSLQTVAQARRIRKLNDAVYELHSPSSSHANVDIVFFHGLQLRDYFQAYTETWSSAKGDECWPQTWLSEDFPNARLLSVSYDSSAIRGANQGNMDMEATGEGLVNSLVLQAGVGKSNPVILVGHSLGGLVIKQVCITAEIMYSARPWEVDLQKFLSNLKGVFFYATPHHGSGLASVAAHLPWYPSVLLKYLTLLNKETESLNESFCELRKKYKWKASGLGEARQVFVPGLPRGVIVVPEESARCDMDYFAQLGEDHMTICKPKGKSCSSYRHLIAFILSTFGEVHLCHGVPIHAAGLHSQVERVIQLLSDAPLVAIVGMAGIGKTTIAKGVFNTISHEFELTCFVNSIKSFSRYEKLEAQILANLYQHGTKLKNCGGDWSVLKGKRVLLVIDDINSRDQVFHVLNAGWFTSGSRIVITTQEQENLRFSEFYIYFARSLNNQASKKLFCHHAFRQENIPAQLKYLRGLVNQVVRICKGIPLALEVIGCSLYRPKYEEYVESMWMANIKSFSDTQDVDGGIDSSSDIEALDGGVDSSSDAEGLQRVADSSLWRKLKVGYDGLGAQEKSMFLDVTTILYGLPFFEIQAAWSTSWGNSDAAWLNLVQRGLVKRIYLPVSGESVVFTHEVLRDLGRRITLENQSRVFDDNQEDQVLQLLSEHKKNAHVQGLMLRRWRKAWGSSLDLNSLASCTDLKFLFLKNIPVIGSCDKLPKGLSLLQWRVSGSSVIRLSTLSHLSKLAVLELDARAQAYEGTLDEVAKGIGSLTELHVLKLQGDFQHLPPNFGELQQLQHITLSSGARLTRLPESFGSLSSLHELVLSNNGLDSLPDSFGLLSSLKKLRLECFHLRGLPSSFGQLSALETLHLFCCEQIEELPESFGELSKLKLLEINVCPKLKGLPDSFGQLHELKKLTISYCGMLNWPHVFGPLPSLLKLELFGFDYLPDTLGNLASLENLRLSDIHVKHLPKSFKQLASLQRVQIEKCHYIADWHVVLHEMGLIGFHQRILQEAESSMLEVFVYLRRGLTGLGPEGADQIANRIITKHFPHVSRWEWPKAVEVGPVLRQPNPGLLYGRSISQILRH